MSKKPNVLKALKAPLLNPAPLVTPPVTPPTTPLLAGLTGSEINRGFNAANLAGTGPTAEGNIASRFAAANPAPPAAPPAAPRSFFSRLAGGAVPTLAGSIGSAMFAQENPVNAASDKDLMYMAEANPVFYANNKARVDQAIANAGAQASKPEVVTPGTPQRGVNRLATSARKPATTSAATSAKPALPPGMQPAATYRDDIKAATITATRPEGTATMRRFTGAGTTLPANDKERIAGIASRISPENPYGADVVGLARPGAKQGGWVGAATDAEAARNLQERALQDQATQAEVARLDRSTEALRSLRETRSPKASFGVDVIGSGPSKLDVASGRVINRDTPASVVADRMTDAAQTARRFGAGSKAGREIAKQIGDAYTADKSLQAEEMKAGAENARGAAQFANTQAYQQAQLGLQERQLNRSLTADEYNRGTDAEKEFYKREQDQWKQGQDIDTENQKVAAKAVEEAKINPAETRAFGMKLWEGFSDTERTQVGQRVPGLEKRLLNNSLTPSDILELDRLRQTQQSATPFYRRWFGETASPSEVAQRAYGTK